MHPVILGRIGHQLSIICSADESQTQLSLITQLVVELVFEPTLSDFFFSLDLTLASLSFRESSEGYLLLWVHCSHSASQFLQLGVSNREKS